MAKADLPLDYSALKGNSKKGKQAADAAKANDEVAIEKIVEGAVIVKEESVGTKLKSLFFGEDFRQVVRYVTAEVLLPAARNLIVDATTRGIERAVYGESQARQKQPQYYGHTSYHTPVRRPPSSVMLPDQPPRLSAGRAPSNRPGQSVILADRDEAELVLERMIDVLSQYEVVSVADMHELIGVNSKHTDAKWGWYNLATAQVRQTREGYLIDLPAPEPI